MPVNFRLVAEEVRYIVEHSGASLLLVDPELDEALSSVTCARRLVIGKDADEALLRFGVEPEPWAGDEDATATINYTSGTTARPKGVQLTHRNIWLNATTFGWHMGVTDRDVYLHTLPQFHCNGWGMLYAVTGMGGQHIVLRKVDGAEILRRVERHGVTLMCGAPAVVNMVLDAAARLGRRDPRPRAGAHRRRRRSAADAHDRARGDRAGLGVQPDLRAHGDLAAADDQPLAGRVRRPVARRPGGQAQPGRRAGDRLRDARSTSPGEVLARSNVVMEGYWQQPEATAEAIVDGWFRTGDGGSIDEFGYVTISDRKKDVIISGGENVSSIEVEDAIFQHPDVTEVAVIGIPDEKWGELVTALVVKAEGSELTADEVIAWTRQKLAGYKCPKRVEFRDALDRTATGKLQKFKLRAPFWEGQTRQVN